MLKKQIKNKLDNLEMCEKCYTFYEFCPCDKKIKEMVLNKDYVSYLSGCYLEYIKYPVSLARDTLLKTISGFIKKLK